MGYISGVKQFADDLQSLSKTKKRVIKKDGIKFLDVWLEHLSESMFVQFTEMCSTELEIGMMGRLLRFS